MERGLVPISHADTPAALAEERRLLHVALTRSREHLHLTRAERRTIGGRDAMRKPSPYLAAIEDALAGRPPQPASPRHAKHALAKARDRLALVTGDPTAPDAARLFDALVAWRRDLARVAKVPAYVIFNDATLAAVAGTRPTTHGALLALPGIGPVKVERYGDAVLDVVRRIS
jgi:DNA helicase-2/ATP-dependent DNA helicase PcrA